MLLGYQELGTVKSIINDPGGCYDKKFTVL